MGYVRKDLAADGTALHLMVRGKPLPAPRRAAALRPPPLRPLNRSVPMARTPPISATPRTTNGCAWMATSPPSASPTTRRSSSATWCSSSCPRSAATSPPARPAPWWRASRRRRDVYAPLAGKVVETNQTIVDDPSIVNSDAEGEGWFFRIEIDDTDAFDALMDAGGLRRISWRRSIDGRARRARRARGGGRVRRAPHRPVGVRHRRDAARGRRGDAGRSGGEDRAGGDPHQPARSICRRRSTRRR